MLDNPKGDTFPADAIESVQVRLTAKYGEEYVLKEFYVPRAEVYREITKLGASIPMNIVKKTLEIYDKDGYGIIAWGRLQIELTKNPDAYETVLLRAYRYEEF